MAKERTVSKTGPAEFTPIQAGIDASSPYDTLTVLDTSTYAEQVTIKAPLHHFTLRSANPTALAKPKILWKDVANVGPKTCEEGLVSANITWDVNGALRLIGARAIRVQGIAIDGGGSAPFAYPSVWGNGKDCLGPKAELFHGNVAVLLSRSGAVQVIDCDIAHAFAGFYIRDDHTTAPFAYDSFPVRKVPMGAFSTGNHLIAGNRIHDNAYGIFQEVAFGLGSTVRDNMIFNNHHIQGTETSVKALPGGSYQPGGAFQLKNTDFISVAIHNNSLFRNSQILVGHWKPGFHPLLANNCFGRPDRYWNDPTGWGSFWQEMLPMFLNRNKHNIIAAQNEQTPIDSMRQTVAYFDTVSQKQVVIDTVLTFYRSVRIMNGMAMPDQESRSGPFQVPSQIYPGALITGKNEVKNKYPSDAQFRWLEMEFQSDDPLDSKFLLPVESQQGWFTKKGWPEFGYMT